MVLGGYDSTKVLVHSTQDTHKEWILDFGCSFYMSPNYEWFQTFKEIHGGTVLLGNNKACKI